MVPQTEQFEEQFEKEVTNFLGKNPAHVLAIVEEVFSRLARSSVNQGMADLYFELRDVIRDAQKLYFDEIRVRFSVPPSDRG